MPTYAYTARDSAGKSHSGTVEGVSSAEAVQRIRADGKYPVNVRLAGAVEGDGGGALRPTAPVVGAPGMKIGRAQLIQFATQLAVMVETGVTLSEAIDCIARQADHPTVKKLLADLHAQIQSGNPLSAAMGRHPRSFPRIFTALIKASEKTGQLSKLLNRGVQYLRDEQDTIRRVKGALTYPGIMLAFAVSTTVFLLAFVLPKFTAIYANKKAALPTPTKVLMNLSDFLVNHYVLIIAAAAGIAAAVWAYVRTPGGSRVWHYLQLRVPLLGPLFKKVHLARGLRMVGAMAGAGVQLTDCVATAHDLCPNSYFKDLWRGVSEQIHAGKQFSEPLFQSALVPRSIAQMISSGEKSGKLGFVMEQVATFSESELKEKITSLTRYIEPAMIVIMGFIIGGVAMALLLPIFTISRVMTQA